MRVENAPDLVIQQADDIILRVTATAICGSDLPVSTPDCARLGDAFDKGLTFAMGQTHVQKYMPQLLQYVEDGALQPDIIISHRRNQG